MSMMGTLAKVAIGVALAKGADHLMSRGGTGRGGLLGAAGGGTTTGGGIESMIGGLLSGGGPSGQGGLGGLMGALGGGRSSASTGGAGGDINALIGSLTGGSSGGIAGGSGGLGGMLGSMLGAVGGGAAAAGASAGFSDLLNQALAGGGEPQDTPNAGQEAVAALMLRAMIQSAMADGDFGPVEQQRIVERLGDVSAEEKAFVEAEMNRSVDPQALANEVPRGLEEQVYTMAVMGIRLDDEREAQFLHQLASALRLSRDDVNHIHTELGAPPLYG